MRNELEHYFPIWAVEKDFIISKQLEITAAFRISLPEIFTLADIDYERINTLWVSAISILPEYTIVHKQDWYLQETYQSDFTKESSFLDRSSEEHFHERPYLEHTSYLFLTKSRKNRRNLSGAYTMLVRGKVLPGDINRLELQAFSDAVEQFRTILNDSGLIRIERITAPELAGTEGKRSLFEKYLSLTQTNQLIPYEDIQIEEGEFRIGDIRTCVYSLSAPEQLPPEVSTHAVWEPFSTTRTDFPVSFTAPVGLHLSCNHIYNQYILVEDSEETIRLLEAESRKMYSLAQLSRSNELGSEQIDEYVEEAVSGHKKAVRAHCNIVAWGGKEEIKGIRNEVGAALTRTGCKIHHNTVDAILLYWAGIPGNAGDLPREECYYTFVQNAVALWIQETNYRTSLSPYGIRLVDRISGVPVYVDLSEEPMQEGGIHNRNKYIYGESGTGKSFFVCHLMYSNYKQGAHCLFVDMGNSYEAVCLFINQQTKGADGIYYRYTEENPISFNPFYTEDGVYDIEKIESLKTLILSLWKRGGEKISGSEEVTISNMVSGFLRYFKKEKRYPCFDTFYAYVDTVFRKKLTTKNVREKEFDIENFLYVLEPYYKDGEYGYLLNSKANIDLMTKRFVVFEIDAIKDNKVLFPVVTLIIMESYVSKLRRLPGVRKIILLEEAWKAIAKTGMAEFIKYLYKTVRKYYGEVITVTQEIDDIVSSEIVKESIIMNSDCKILLDQSKYLNKFDKVQNLLGLTDKQKTQILSMNRANDPARKYKEVWISLGMKHSAVYGTEVSRAEYYTYTTEEKEKQRVFQVAKEKTGGNLQQAIQFIVNS